MNNFTNLNNMSVNIKDPMINSEPSESLDIQPWNSGRLSKITAQMKGRVQHNRKSVRNKSDIFSLSNRTPSYQISGREEQKEIKGINMSNLHQKTKSFEDKILESSFQDKPSTAPYSRRRKFPIKKIMNMTDISQ